MEQNNTWEYANLPPGRKAIPCKWVFKTKTDATGNIERRKARLVAKGFLQIHGVDFDETYAPTAKYASIRLLLSIAATADLEIHHIDVKNAYLHADLKEEIYMNSPPGQQAPEGKVLRLRKALYGLKQGGKSWYDTISRQLETQGFIRCASENSVFRREASNTEIICLYVDDIIIIAPTPDIVQNIKVDLAKFFSITDLGPLKYFLGIQITRDRQKRTIALSKTTFIQGTLKNFNMNDCNPVDTPLTPGHQLPLPGTETSQLITQYQTLLGKLMYAMLVTRPDLAYAIATLSQFSHNPASEHWTAAKRVLLYLQATKNKQLVLGGNGTTITGYSDADWEATETPGSP